MNVQQSYSQWAAIYDSNMNKIRDMEAIALRNTLGGINFRSCLEIGCGTGKNTAWLATQADFVKAIDLTEEMLAVARQKIKSANVAFEQADVTLPWTFTDRLFDVVTFSLVLEHIENLDHIFSNAHANLTPGGQVYIGELHPFKQYTGSKARFETAEGTHTVMCYDHHISEFLESARKYNLELVSLNEHFDDGNDKNIPRLLTLLFKKSEQ